MDVLSDCNLVFTILFTIECVMKLSSFGPKAYFKVSIIIIVLHSDTGLHNSWVRNNGTTQHNFCWFHCWVPINPHQLMFIKGWVPNISNQQLCNQQLVSIWSAWLLGTQLLGCAAFDPTLDQTFQILSLFVELVSKI